MNPSSMYPGDYVSVVPRLLPSHWSSSSAAPNTHQIPFSVGDDVDRSMNVKGSPSGQFPPLSTRNQQRGSPSSLTRYSNDSSPLNKGRVQGNRIFHEPLKDHSDESHYPYPPLYSDPFSRSPYDNGQRGQQDPLSLLKIFLIIFGLIIALFSLTALAISIYLLVKLSNSGNIT